MLLHRRRQSDRDPDADGLLPFKAQGTVTIDGLTVSSGKELRLSPNPEFFEGYTILQR